ncbi:MAG: hypothetical protein IJY92_03895 [Alphaproteobacteria bacterium]|nr:hypothetical protein [Alphaproteobacteria bacterium]
MLKYLLLFTGIMIFFISPANAKTHRFEINPPRELDFLPLHQIFHVRKNMVNRYHILDIKNYNPTQSPAFKQVLPNKPWWGVKGMFCYASGKLSIEGVSEESRFIDNPFALINVHEANALFFKKKKGNCPSSYIYLEKLTFNDENNTFYATYNASTHYNRIKKMASALTEMQAFTFGGINAVDFEIPYAKMILKENITFKNGKNISNTLYKFKDFIHLGHSCGYKGGCNNGSPYQPELVFKIEKFPAKATFHLYKTPPTHKDETPFITYHLTIK